MTKPIITRFAPSPTGYLHIGGARTALFNMLFARHFDGLFLLRIEDTDHKRSSQKAIDAIVDGLDWLGLSPDRTPIFQSMNLARHAEIAKKLLNEDKAYLCFCSPEELAEMRQKALAEKRSPKYDGRWRDRDPKDAPVGVSPVIRFKAPQDGHLIIDDLVQGEIKVANEELDDMVLLRADGSPTYMLSVVVDDHDMQVTHVIRGDDHLTNAFRQTILFKALEWQPPNYAHIPLIHGPDGNKLSKRHGALGIEAYRDIGYLPEALLNYLARLGWSHGDDEVFSISEAISWFDGSNINKSAARLDFNKLNSINTHYIKNLDFERFMQSLTQRTEVPQHVIDRLKRGLPGLLNRSKTLNELTEKAAIYLEDRPLKYTEELLAQISEEDKLNMKELSLFFIDLDTWDEELIKEKVHVFVEQKGIKLGEIAKPLRVALSGSMSSPGVFELAFAFGKEEVLARIEDFIT